jgi:hypothetical protein
MKASKRTQTRRSPTTMPQQNGTGPVRKRTDVIRQNFHAADEEMQFLQVMQDYRAAYRHLQTNESAEYAGQYVAFLDGQLVDADPSSADLRARVSETKNVHPERIAIVRVLDQAVL